MIVILVFFAFVLAALVGSPIAGAILAQRTSWQKRHVAMIAAAPAPLLMACLIGVVGILSLVGDADGGWGLLQTITEAAAPLAFILVVYILSAGLAGLTATIARRRRGKPRIHETFE